MINMGCITDKGNYRSKNQDRIMCRRELRENSVLAVACVCDGIGSFEESEIASEMMISGVSAWFDGVARYYPKVMSKDGLIEDLEITIQELNELVYEYREENHVDIGCTMSLILMIDFEYYILHVGDSKIYCLNDTFYKMTQDEVMLKQVNGKEKTLLVNYIGKSSSLCVNRQFGQAKRGNLFVLGSDGLFKKLNQEDVYSLSKCMKSDDDVEGLCRKLVALVLKRKETDNVSCAVLQVT